MNLENYGKLFDSVKIHEGFRNSVYKDTLGKRTVGYGHLCVEDHWEDNKAYEKEYLEKILEKDLWCAIEHGEDLIGEAKINDGAKILIVEMIFQLGKTGVSKFRNMWKALQKDPPDYKEASVQMLDSRWAKQTPERAKEMAGHMAECVV